MKDVKIGDKFTQVRIEIDATMDIVKCKTDSFKVIGISEYYICLNDSLFTTLSISKTFDFCHSKPEEVNISEKTNSTEIRIFGKFNISMYSQMSKKRIENKINKEFNKWLNKKIGVYGAATKINIKL